MESAATLAVVFGTGPLGRAVCDRLIEHGWRVRLTSRSTPTDIPAGVEHVAGDACNTDFTRDIARDASVVFHCANANYARWPSEFPPLHAGILAGATSAGAKLIFGDNLYAYGPVDGPLREELPNRATGSNGRVRIAMAASVMAAHARGELRAAIGRASDFYGPGVLLAFIGERVFLPALKGKSVQVLGNPDMPHTFSYVRDFGRALVTLAEHDEALGQIWHVPSAPTITTRQILELVFKEIGTSPKIAVAPMLIVKAMAMFNPTLRAVLEQLYQFERPFVMDSSKFVKSFGGSFTPHTVAIHETAEWYRARL
jgi:nucleoside-diphosphate-sugar epimerase